MVLVPASRRVRICVALDAEAAAAEILRGPGSPLDYTCVLSGASDIGLCAMLFFFLFKYLLFQELPPNGLTFCQSVVFLSHRYDPTMLGPTQPLLYTSIQIKSQQRHRPRTTLRRAPIPLSCSKMPRNSRDCSLWSAAHSTEEWQVQQGLGAGSTSCPAHSSPSSGCHQEQSRSKSPSKGRQTRGSHVSDMLLMAPVIMVTCRGGIPTLRMMLVCPIPATHTHTQFEKA